MSYLPNTQIEQYLGNINLFLIRESHTVREVTKILDLPSCIFYRGRMREVYKNHVNCFSRLRVPLFFLRDSRASETRPRVKIARKARLAFLAWGNFHARSRFVRSSLPEEKWGRLVVYCFRANVVIFIM